MHLASSLILAVALGGAREDFAAQWNDWKAELSGYRLTQPRYGQARAGHAVMIWVTEPFSKSKHVKLDKPEAAGADRVEVMKLNLVRRFRTGVYDYNLLTSVFSPIAFERGRPRLPEKVAFSSQEWCGAVFAQLTRDGAGMRSTWNSYFEAEGDGSAQLAADDEAVFDDDLWWKLRELAQPFPPGKHRFYPSLTSVRLAHAPMTAGTLEAKRGAAEELKVPAGTFKAIRWELSMTWAERKQTRTVWVEDAPARRILAWDGEVPSFTGSNEPARERAELTGSFRDTYWQHNKVEDDALFDKLGITPRR
jgi:hypothetical protein